MALSKKQKQILDKYKKEGGEAKGKVDGFFSKVKSLGKKAHSEAIEGAKGLGKSFVETAAGASDIGQKGLEFALQAALPKSLEPRFGFTDAPQAKPTDIVSRTITGQNVKDLTTPKTTGQSVGKFVGDIGTFLIPGSQGSSIAKTPAFASRFGKLAQPLAQGTAAFLTEATKQGGVTQSAAGSGLFTAGVTGAVPVIGKGLGAITSKVNPPKTYSGLLNYAKKLGDKSGVSASTINMLAKATKPEKAMYSRLIQQAANRMKDTNVDHPVSIIGKNILSDFNKLASNTKVVGQKLGGIKSKLINSPRNFNAQSVRNNLTKELKKIGAKIDAVKGEISFPSSFSSAEQKLISSAYSQLSNMSNTAQAINFIDDFAKRLDVVKQSGKVSSKTPVEGLLSNVRTQLSNKLGKVENSYKDLSKKYAISQSAIQNLKKKLGMSQFADEQVLGMKAGELARQLINRNTSRPTELVNTLYKALKQYDPKINPQQKLQQFNKQVNFTDLLEDIYNVAPVSSFKGATESAIKEVSEEMPKTLTGIMNVGAGKLIDTAFKKAGLVGSKADVAKEALATALKLVPQAEQEKVAKVFLQSLVGVPGFALSNLPESPQPATSGLVLPEGFRPSNTPGELNVPAQFTPSQQP